MQLIDLHSHSYFSDGELSPTDLLAFAHVQGVTQLALTDHDTTEGIVEAQQAAEQHKIRLIPGVEISCQWLSFAIHIIGLNIDINNTALQAALADNVAMRVKRAHKIAEKLASLGIEKTFKDAQAVAGKHVIARPHFARVLVDRGLVSDIPAAFKRYLGNNKLADVPTEWMPVAKATQLIVEAGGVAVVAHPARYKMNSNKLRRMISDFMDAGGQALEVVTSSRSTDEIARFTQLCQELDLYASVGSDYHGPHTGRAVLGRIPKLPTQCRPVWQLFDEGSAQ